MQKQDTIVHEGWFNLAGRRILGRLSLDGRQTIIYFHDEQFFHLTEDVCDFITGTLHDLRKITLVNCSSLEWWSTSAGGESRWHQKLAPHFVLIGERQLDPADPAITHLSLLTDDAEAIFPDFDAFGTSFEPVQHIEALAQEYEEIVGRPVPLGPSPSIRFFGGRKEVMAVDTAIGRVSARHRPALGFSNQTSAHGLRNRIWLELQFDEPVSFETAIERTVVIMRFVEVIAGRPQNLERMSVQAPSEGSHGALDVDWLFPLARSDNEGAEPVSVIDLLINPISNRLAFESVLAMWLGMDAERRLPRSRFSTLFGQQNRFDPDRLVAAANMFDLLPTGALPPKPTLDEDIRNAKSEARALFRLLPPSDERQAILGALKRIGERTLRHKIMHRAQIIDDRIRPRLSHLDLVVREAVKMRNYFVHGEEPSFDYAACPGLSSFLTEVLEFIYSASELVEAGWNIQEWISRHTTLSHPFKRLIKSWDIEAEMLRKAKGLPKI